MNEQALMICGRPTIALLPWPWLIDAMRELALYQCGTCDGDGYVAHKYRPFGSLRAEVIIAECPCCEGLGMHAWQNEQ